MVRGYKDFLHKKICEMNLIKAAKIACKVKQLPFIPLYEVLCYEQIAKYFSVPEKRVRNIVSGNRKMFNDDMTTLNGNDIKLVSIEQKDLGCHYGVVFTFPNGIKVNASYNTNTVFNARSLLHFAIILYDESNVAKKITDMLYDGFYKDTSVIANLNLPRMLPWFKFSENADDFENNNEVLSFSSNEPITIEINIK